jgi:hypothetical protein
MSPATKCYTVTRSASCDRLIKDRCEQCVVRLRCQIYVVVEESCESGFPYAMLRMRKAVFCQSGTANGYANSHTVACEYPCRGACLSDSLHQCDVVCRDACTCGAKTTLMVSSHSRPATYYIDLVSIAYQLRSPPRFPALTLQLALAAAPRPPTLRR